MKEKPEGKRFTRLCLRCLYTWLSKKNAADIRACPSCKSTKWNRRDICPTCGSVKRKERKKNDKK